MSAIADNLNSIRATLHPDTTLVAVSKFHSENDILQAYQVGQRIFGESQVQELMPKAQHLPNDIAWHFIGHLQTNKVKYIAPFVSLIHSVDSLRLMQEINRQALRCQRTIDVLLELHIAQEDSKFGLTTEACRKLLISPQVEQLTNIRIRGLMTMASFVDNQQQIAAEFEQANAFWQEMKQTHFADNPDFNLRSWGMSDDYLIAQQHGANMVRVGSAIFGQRTYNKQ